MMPKVAMKKQPPLWSGVTLSPKALRKRISGRTKATVTEPRAPAMLMKSVKVLTVKQMKVVTRITDVRIPSFLRNCWNLEWLLPIL